MEILIEPGGFNTKVPNELLGIHKTNPKNIVIGYIYSKNLTKKLINCNKFTA